MTNDWLLLKREPNLSHPEDAYVILGATEQRWKGLQWTIVAAGDREAVEAARRLMLVDLEVSDGQ